MIITPDIKKQIADDIIGKNDAKEFYIRPEKYGLSESIDEVKQFASYLNDILPHKKVEVINRHMIRIFTD